MRGLPALKAAAMVTRDTPITLGARSKPYVSRGGEKLDAALGDLDVRVQDRRWLDAGASTGGFTHRLLEGGAAGVVALDVGYGQLDWTLRNHERVVVLERVNARTLTPVMLPWAPEGVVADLSFISLTIVLPALVAVAREDADFVLLVKPQFEVGRGRVGRGGVVRDPELWAGAIAGVVRCAQGLGLALAGVAPSPLAGPAGNREFFVHLHRGATGDDDAIGAAIEAVRA